MIAGVDMGNKLIKICQFDIRGGVIYDVCTEIREIDADEEKTDKAASEIISNVFKEKKNLSRIVASSAGSPDLLMRLVDLPTMPKNELENTIKLQAEKFIYADLKEMDIDFTTIYTRQDKMGVLLVACPGKVADNKMTIFQSAKLDMIILDADSLALANCYLKFYPDTESHSAILLNIGDTVTNLIIINKRNFCFAKNIGFGGRNIASEISKELKIHLDKARQLKDHGEMWDEVGLNIKNILKKCSPDLLEVIFRAVEYATGQNMIQTVDKIIITGGTSYLQGIDEFFSGIFGIKAEVWDPFSSIEVLKDRPGGQFMAVAMGLALREN